MSIVQRFFKFENMLVPDSMVQSGSLTTGTITATFNSIAYAATLSGLSLQNLYFCYLRMNSGTLQLFFNTSAPSVYRLSFPEAILVGAFYTNTSSQFQAFVSTRSQTPSTFVAMTATGTYTTPPQLIALKLRGVGGGGGGGGSGTSGWTNGTSGGTTSFGSVLSCPGGLYGVWTGAATTPGGDITVTSPAVQILNAEGASTSGGSRSGQSNSERGNDGGSSVFGGSGRGGSSGDINSSTGGNGAANSGSGGGGAGASIQGAAVFPGSGGQPGTYGEAIIYGASNLNSTYSVTIGAGGSVGTPAGSGGGNGGVGGSGVVYVEEIKPNLEQLSIL